MSYDSKVEAASTRIKQHNDALGNETSGQIDFDKFVKALKSFGATSEEALSKLSWEDILDCLCPAIKTNAVPGEVCLTVLPIKPKLLARDLAVIFRGKEETKEEKAVVNPGAKKVRQMTLRQLVEVYDPAENNEVAKRLAEISKGHPFVVFKTGHIVNVEATLVLLEELKAGYPPRQFYEVEGVPQEVQPLGFIPDNYAEENPIYSGRPLRPDGTCDQTNRSWAGVEHQVKQFLRVGLEMGIIKVNRLEDAHYFMDLVMNSTEPMKVLRQRYAAVSVQFDKLAKEGKLPTLKISLSLPKAQKSNGGAKTSPFDGGKRVQWIAPASPASNYYRPAVVREADWWKFQQGHFEQRDKGWTL